MFVNQIGWAAGCWLGSGALRLVPARAIDHREDNGQHGVLSSSLGLIHDSQGVSLFLEAAGHSMIHKKEVHP